MTSNPHFTPCPMQDGDEMYPNGIFEFNITAMLTFIESNPEAVELKDVAVKEFCREDYFLDTTEIDSFDVNRPVLLAEIAPGRYNLIDGYHRVEKARRLGMDTVPAYMVPPDVHVRFLTSLKAYQTYVKYWNSKVNQMISREA